MQFIDFQKIPTEYWDQTKQVFNEMQGQVFLHDDYGYLACHILVNIIFSE